MIFAIRGATTVERDEEELISAAAVELVKEIVAANKIDTAISITVSTTADITASYPAKAIRESRILSAPLFSCLEPPISGALPLCIRVIILADGEFKKHIYLHGAKVLRPDLG